MSDTDIIENIIREVVGENAKCYIETDREYKRGYTCIIEDSNGQETELNLLISKKVLENKDYSLIKKAIRNALKIDF